MASSQAIVHSCTCSCTNHFFFSLIVFASFRLNYLALSLLSPFYSSFSLALLPNRLFSSRPLFFRQTRLKKEFQRIQKEPAPFVEAAPLESNILEWHYVITGPPDTVYHGGYYHGKIKFPSDYPYVRSSPVPPIVDLNSFPMHRVALFVCFARLSTPLAVPFLGALQNKTRNMLIVLIR
jgi:hypothetical protein